MSDERILFVDDEANVLRGIERHLEDDYELQVCNCPCDALKAVKEEGPFAVVVSDMRMPNMSGVELLSQIRDETPDTVRVILTGFADIESTVAAVNQGHVFRFLTKPCANEDLRSAVDECLRQYRLIRAEKELVEGTLMGSVKMLSDVLSLVNPVAFGRATRVRGLATRIANEMEIEDHWEVEIAAMLSSVGCVTLAEETLEKMTTFAPLSPEEQTAFDQHPELGKSLLQNIPRLENVAEIVACQDNHFAGRRNPGENAKGDDIPLGARILKVALDLDTQVARTSSPTDAISRMEAEPDPYDPEILRVAKQSLDALFPIRIEEKPVYLLNPGMIIAEDIVSDSGALVVVKGLEVTESVIRVLNNYEENGRLVSVPKVFVDS